jgi:PhnB protein
MASDVQPLLYIEDLERGIAFYRDQLGFDVAVFGHHKASGAPLIAGAKLEDAFVLLSNEELFRDGGATGGGNVRLYFHLESSVDDLFDRITRRPDVEIVQPPTDQHWGDRTLIVRDPWGVLLVFSNPAGGVAR